MKNIKLFIWDFDGTLMDTYPNLTGYMHRALLDLGHDVPQVEILEQMLENVPHTIAYFAEKFGLDTLEQQYMKYYAAGANDPVKLFPGVKSVLRRIRELGADSFIYTNRGQSIFPMLESTGILEDFREVVNTASPAFVYKPAPDAILYLMEKYGGTPETTVMIGDRVCDLESGYRAGCKTCHLLTPSVPQYPRCDWRIRDFAQMLSMLE
ncbi:MAG: HAD hydrolase-like protein [Faecousia sp.]